MTDDMLRRTYATLLAGRPMAGRAGCVSPEALLALVERRGAEPERLSTLDHVMACSACRRDFEVLRAIAVAGAELGDMAVGSTRSRAMAPGLRLAASVALVVAAGGAALVLARRGGDTAPLRGGTRGDGISAIAPAGEVPIERARTMVWHGTRGASTYLVEVVTLSGDSIVAAATGDTVLSLPSSVTLEAGREYLWTVRVRLRDGSQLTAPPLRFRITP